MRCQIDGIGCHGASELCRDLSGRKIDARHVQTTSASVTLPPASFRWRDGGYRAEHGGASLRRLDLGEVSRGLLRQAGTCFCDREQCFADQSCRGHGTNAVKLVSCSRDIATRQRALLDG